MMRRFFAILLISVVLTAPSYAADAAAPAEVEHKGVVQKLSDRIFNGLKKLTETVAARLSAMDDVELTINSITKDERNRMYVDVDGDVDIKFPMMPGKLKAYMEALPGYHLQSTGPLNVEYSVSVCEATGEKSFHVMFHAQVIIVIEEVLGTLVKFASSVVGTVTLMGLGNDLAQVVDGINGATLSHDIHEGLRNLGIVMSGLAGVEAYDAWRGIRHDRDHLEGESGTTTVLVHLAVAVVKGALSVGTSFAGMTLGAALGTALFPGVGSTVGAIVGAAGFTLVGNVLYSKLTVDLPVAYRLGRIRRMTQNAQASTSDTFRAFLTSGIAKQEDKVVKRVAYELRTDKFTYFDQLVSKFKRVAPADRAAYASLRDKLESMLKFEVVNRQDRLFALKLNQLRDSFGDQPLAFGAQ